MSVLMQGQSESKRTSLTSSPHLAPEILQMPLQYFLLKIPHIISLPLALETTTAEQALAKAVEQANNFLLNTAAKSLSVYREHRKCSSTDGRVLVLLGVPPFLSMTIPHLG